MLRRRADDLELVLDVIEHRDEKTWQELLDELRQPHDANGKSGAAVRRSCGKEHTAPREMEVRLEDHTHGPIHRFASG